MHKLNTKKRKAGAMVFITRAIVHSEMNPPIKKAIPAAPAISPIIRLKKPLKPLQNLDLIEIVREEPETFPTFQSNYQVSHKSNITPSNISEQVMLDLNKSERKRYKRIIPDKMNYTEPDKVNTSKEKSEKDTSRTSNYPEPEKVNMLDSIETVRDESEKKISRHVAAAESIGNVQEESETIFPPDDPETSEKKTLELRSMLEQSKRVKGKESKLLKEKSARDISRENSVKNISRHAPDEEGAENAQEEFETIFPPDDPEASEQKTLVKKKQSKIVIPPLRFNAEESKVDPFKMVLKAQSTPKKYFNRNSNKRLDNERNDFWDEVFAECRTRKERSKPRTKKNAKSLLEAGISLFQDAFPMINDLSKKYNCQTKLRRALKEASRTVEE